jgi:hypothetical protein
MLAWSLLGEWGQVSIQAGAFTFLIAGYGTMLTVKRITFRIIVLSFIAFSFWLLIHVGREVLSVIYYPNISKYFNLKLGWPFELWVTTLPFVFVWAHLSRITLVKGKGVVVLQEAQRIGQ